LNVTSPSVHITTPSHSTMGSAASVKTSAVLQEGVRVSEAGLEACVGSEGLGRRVWLGNDRGRSEVPVGRLKMQVHASAENLRQSLAVLGQLLEGADESGGIWMEWVLGDEGKRWLYCQMKEEIQYFIYCRRAGLNHFVQNSSVSLWGGCCMCVVG
jgi:hypothetical protein